MRETYIRPELDVIEFEMEDVITASVGIDDVTGEVANEIDGWIIDFY